MIIKANSRKDGGQLAKYLLTENAQQKAFLLDHRGSVADDLNTILRSWEAEALAMTKGEKPLYHMVLRLAPDEALQQEQWFRALDVVEQKLKLADHPRAVVAHNLNGETHLHVVYSRLDAERGKLMNMGNDRKAHHAAARQMEKEFGLRELDSTPKRERNGNEKTRSIEHRMAREAGTTRKTLCAAVRFAWNASDTGRQFQEQLARFGMALTPGDRRDFNLIHEGKRYNPVRLLEKVQTAEFRAKMQIDPPEFAHEINDQAAPAHTGPGHQPIRRRAKDLIAGQAAPELMPPESARPAHQAAHRWAGDLTHRQFARAVTNDNEATLARIREGRKPALVYHVGENKPAYDGISLEP